ADKSHDVFVGRDGLWQGQRLKDVRHVLPDLELDRHAGGVRTVGGAHRLVAQNFEAACLKQQWRKARKIGVQRRHRRIEEAIRRRINNSQRYVRGETV